MSGMHLLPVYYTTTNIRKRKKQKKSESLLAAEQAHAKYLKKMKIGSRSSVGSEQWLSKPWVTDSNPVESTNDKTDVSNWTPCTKVYESYKLGVSGQYVVGQAYNKGGLQVLSKKEQDDPATGKRR